MKGCVYACMLSCVRLFETPWTVAHQVPLSMGFPRQEYWSGMPFSPPGGLPDPGIEPVFLLAGEFFTAELSGNPKGMYWVGQKVRTLMNFLANPIYKTLGVVADLSVCIQPSWLS